MKYGSAWGPIESGFYEVEGPASVLLNEWNAVDDDELLAGGDAALGQLPGNGGDWIELVVTEAVDLRGWRITMEDRLGPAGDLTFGDDPLLSDLAPGTLLTIAEALPEDPAYDPAGGDWRFHLRASAGASGRYVTAADFDVTALDWRLTLWDAEGNIRFGPVGESVAPRSGISGSEVGRLEGAADSGVRRDSDLYSDGTGSTYGGPNTWDDEEQDLGWVPEGTVPVEEPGPTPKPPTADSGAAPSGCANAPAGGLGLLLLAFLAACGRITPTRAAETGTAATDPPDADADGDGSPDPLDCDDDEAGIYPGAPERCDEEDNDCDQQTDEDPVDGLPFYVDGDGDGFGADGVVAACRLGRGLALADGDCDDADPTRYPDAVEACDEIDQNCDGQASDAAGTSPDCPVESCLAQLIESPGSADGAYWIALAAGGVAQVWCDQTTEGGGWTLGFLRNTAASGSQGEFGGADVPADSLGVSPQAASSAPAGSLGWLDLEAFSWTSLRVAAYASGVETFRSREIRRSDLRIPFGSPGYLLYGGPTGYFWCGGPATYTDAGIGAVNNPVDAPPDCKGHGGLGSGWDFSESNAGNLGLTLCGGDASNWMYTSWAAGMISYGVPGGAQALWVR